jgi:hypothetical protein
MADTFSSTQVEMLADIKHHNAIILNNLTQQMKAGDYVRLDLLGHLMWIEGVMRILMP